MQADPFIEPINAAIDSGVEVVTFAADSPDVEPHLLRHLGQCRRKPRSPPRRSSSRSVRRASTPYSKTPARAITTCAITALISYMEEHYPGMELVGRQATNQDSNEAYSATGSILQANPELDAMWIPEAGSAEGAVAAILEADADVLDHSCGHHADDA